MQHCILVKWTPDAGDRDALAKEAEAISAQAVAGGVATALTSAATSSTARTAMIC